MGRLPELSEKEVSSSGEVTTTMMEHPLQTTNHRLIIEISHPDISIDRDRVASESVSRYIINSPLRTKVDIQLWKLIQMS